MREEPRVPRARQVVGRERTQRRASPRWNAGVLGAVLLAAGAGCSERERPGFIADPQGGGDQRTVSGSFRAPAAGGSAGQAGAASAPTSDGGTARPSGSGGEGAGVAGSGGEGSDAASAPLALQQNYEGTCDGSTVQWGFFTYDAATPGDSSIGFRVRTAPTEAELENATYIELVTASTALRTAQCSFTGPAPCPIDLYDALDGPPLAHHPFAQLQVLLSPDSADGRMPAVEEWQLTFSCTFNQ